eukprot:GILK01008204.1.p1 GENE.GILK01008204.1~~GILK01008204.1.p1  ORF type:complete len:451 (-),score=80.58 GILK01008204.1:143-1495(-)
MSLSILDRVKFFENQKSVDSKENMMSDGAPHNKETMFSSSPLQDKQQRNFDLAFASVHSGKQQATISPSKCSPSKCSPTKSTTKRLSSERLGESQTFQTTRSSGLHKRARTSPLNSELVNEMQEYDAKLQDHKQLLKYWQNRAFLPDKQAKSFRSSYAPPSTPIQAIEHRMEVEVPAEVVSTEAALEGAMQDLKGLLQCMKPAKTPFNTPIRPKTHTRAVSQDSPVAATNGTPSPRTSATGNFGEQLFKAVYQNRTSALSPTVDKSKLPPSGRASIMSPGAEQRTSSRFGSSQQLSQDGLSTPSRLLMPTPCSTPASPPFPSEPQQQTDNGPVTVQATDPAFQPLQSRINIFASRHVGEPPRPKASSSHLRSPSAPPMGMPCSPQPYSPSPPASEQHEPDLLCTASVKSKSRMFEFLAVQGSPVQTSSQAIRERNDSQIASILGSSESAT